MSQCVFISYSRRNRPFARRLRTDLLRAGLTPWLDEHGIPFDSPNWEAEIGAAIDRADRVVLLVSPESAASPNVAAEVQRAEATKRPIAKLALAGRPEDYQVKWPLWHINAVPVGEYHDVLSKLLDLLDAPVRPLASLATLLDAPQPRTAAEAAAELGVGPQPPVAEPGFVWLPVWPSGYGMVWLVGPADAPLRRPDPIAVLFQHTGQRGDRIGEVLRAWRAEATAAGAPPWMVVVEGPLDRDEKKYQLETQPRDGARSPQWQDAREACERALSQFASGRRVALYFNTLAPLAFEVGALTKNFLTRRVYHYAHYTTGGYDLVHAGW